MRTLSLDLRERILASYDNDEGTRAEVARRYRVSLGMVKKLLQQRRRTGDLAPRHRFSGRKPLILQSHQRQMRTLLAHQPDLTLPELRQAAGLRCTLPAIHYVLKKMGLTYKKRHSAPANRTVQTSSGRGGAGSGSRPVGIRPGWSSSMNRGQKQI
jgi:transposase